MHVQSHNFRAVRHSLLNVLVAIEALWLAGRHWNQHGHNLKTQERNFRVYTTSSSLSPVWTFFPSHAGHSDLLIRPVPPHFLQSTCTCWMKPVTIGLSAYTIDQS